ncbi:MAG: hypothetical protein ACJAS4_003306 [Bacteriovoracaceae bacterium]|jgi:hypothetical protein
MEKKIKPKLMTLMALLMSITLISCNTSDEGGTSIVAQNDGVTDSNWEDIVVDDGDYDENEEVPALPEVGSEFEYDVETGECLNESLEIGTNINEEFLCGNYEDLPLPEVEIVGELPFGLNINGSFISSEHNIKIKELIKFEVVLNKSTYFEDRPNFLNKIKKTYKKEMIRVLKRLIKWNKSNKKLLKAKERIENKLESTELVSNSKKQARIKRNLLKIKYKLAKIDIKENRLKIKLKYLDKIVKEL